MIKVTLTVDYGEALDVLKALKQRQEFLCQERELRVPGSVESMLLTTEINTLEYASNKIAAACNEGVR